MSWSRAWVGSRNEIISAVVSTKMPVPEVQEEFDAQKAAIVAALMLNSEDKLLQVEASGRRTVRQCPDAAKDGSAFEISVKVYKGEVCV